MSNTSKLLIRCAWEGSSAFASAGYNTTTWAPGSCASLQPPSSPPSPPPSPPSPPPAGTRLSIGAATTEQKARLNDAVLKMKTTASPWASGVIKETGQPVPRRWHNLTWWDTLVTIHSTAHMGGNPFAHFGPAFPMWHRLFLRMLEQVSESTYRNRRASRIPLSRSCWPTALLYSYSRVPACFYTSRD